MPKLHELQERRTQAVAEMRSINDKAEAETRDYSEAEEKRHKELKTELADLDKKIERARDLAEAERRAPAILHNGRGDGNFEQRAREFSVVKAIRSAIGDPVDAGFEREISTETERRTGRKARGILVPDEYFQVEKRAFGDAVMTAASEGADLYPTMHRGDLFIDKLRSAVVVGRLGATVLDGLVGTQDIPRQIGSATGEWLDEDGSITDSQQTFDDVTLTPKTVAGIASYTRRLLINAVPSIENIVRNDLASVVANAIDLAALVGLGASNQPKGVTKQDGVHEIAMTEPLYEVWEKILSFIANIQHSDAEIGSLAWVMNAWAVKKLRSTTKVTDDAVTGWVMQNANSLADYPAAVTSALPGTPGDPNATPTPIEAVPATIIFGAWSQLLVGYWSGTDILVNPYETTAYQKGRVLVRVMRDCDVAVRHPEAFAFADDFVV
jgi:HK97 family phage major capsid protein